MTLAAAGATSVSAPTRDSATAGVAIPFHCDQALILVRSTAGSDTMTATVKVWGYQPEKARWYVVGTLNGGSAIAETETDEINYSELIVGLRGFTRLTVSQAVSGTATATEVVAIPVRAETSTR